MIVPMILQACFLLFLTNLVIGDLYDCMIQKDEEVVEILTVPDGKDTTLFDAMKSLSDSYKAVTNQLQGKNLSIIPLAKKLNDRGVPNMVLETFFLSDLISFFNWHKEETDVFHSLYSEVQHSWHVFENAYRNVSLSL